MTTYPRPRSENVDRAELELKKAIEYYLRFYYTGGDPEDCYTPLLLAMVLLLQGRNSREGKSFPDNAYMLIKSYPQWSFDQKETAHWLRKKRNEIQHPGSSKNKENDAILGEKLGKNFLLITDLYETSGYELDEIFGLTEQKVLRGEELAWHEKATFLARVSLLLQEEEQEVALDTANRAMEIALRGFAQSWRIENAHKLDIDQLLHELDNYEYEYDMDLDERLLGESDALDISRFSRPYYEVPVADGWDLRRPKEGWFQYPMTIHDLAESTIGRFKGAEAALKMYLEEIKAAVNSYINRCPDLDLYECLLRNWHSIMGEVRALSPEIETPEVNERLGIEAFCEEPRAILIHIRKPIEHYGWNENHLQLFYTTVKKYCGENPMEVEIKLHSFFE